eukprot:TRINITY_DN68410_c0_g1_i1.p1 TRINITY_DN68410_c0_g1~~TRINITY_DN68410_c0_g1_i1.p1  ORF type:complete len:176 (-),score=37.07 TRINITY_DN68410_c0_g1_i1:111-638(-)
MFARSQKTAAQIDCFGVSAESAVDAGVREHKGKSARCQNRQLSQKKKRVSMARARTNAGADLLPFCNQEIQDSLEAQNCRRAKIERSVREAAEHELTGVQFLEAEAAVAVAAVKSAADSAVLCISPSGSIEGIDGQDFTTLAVGLTIPKSSSVSKDFQTTINSSEVDDLDSWVLL